MITDIHFQDRVIIRPNVLFREIESESVLLSLESEQYFGLDNIGTQMWHVLTSSHSIGAAYDTLLELYDVDADQLKSDLIELINNLLKNHLIEIQND